MALPIFLRRTECKHGSFVFISLYPAREQDGNVKNGAPRVFNLLETFRGSLRLGGINLIHSYRTLMYAATNDTHF